MANLVLVGVSALWGATFFLIHDAVAHVTPFWFLAVRFVAAAGLLAAWAGLPRRLWWRAGLAGSWLFAGYALQTYGLQSVGADPAAFLTSLSVLLVPLGEWIVWRRRPAPRMLAAVLLAAGGLWLLLTPGGQWTVGAWLTLGCAVAFAAQILATHGTEPRDILGFTAIELSVVALGSTLGAVLTVPHPSLDAPPIAWEAAAFCALFATVLAYLLQTWAQTRTPPTHAALIFTLEPWFAVLFTALFTHRGLAPAAWAGAVLMFAALGLAEWPPRARTAGAPSS